MLLYVDKAHLFWQLSNKMHKGLYKIHKAHRKKEEKKDVFSSIKYLRLPCLFNTCKKNFS